MTTLEAVTPITRYVLICDWKCGAWANHAPAEVYCTPSQAVAAAIELGWIGTLCPKCQKEKAG